MGYRILLAFAVAPVTAVAVLWILLVALGGSPDVGFIVSTLFVACCVVLVVGVPAYAMTVLIDLHAPWGHALVGGAVGLLPVLLIPARWAFIWPFILSTLLASSVAGLVFGLIAGGNRNHSRDRRDT
jgi:hypothetical protein